MKLIKILTLAILLISLFACSSETQTEETAEDKITEDHNHSHDHDHGHNDPVKVMLADTPFEKDGVKFTIPKGWKMVETPIMKVGILLMLEKDGADESGQFMVSILEGDEVPLGSYMQSMRDEISKSLKMQGLEGSFTKTRSENFNGIDILVCEYEHNSGGLDFSGSLKTFYCNGKTMYVFTQSEKEDIARNEKDIGLLEKTFLCSI